MEDERIIELYFARSESAIAETAKKYGKYCFQVSYRILSDRRDAEECVSDTYLKAWNAMPPRKPNRLRTFLGKMTRNLSLSLWERNSAKKRLPKSMGTALEELHDCLPAKDVSADDIADDIALKDAVNGFLRSLPDDTRRIFVQRYWYLYQVKEIAAANSMTESNVKMTLLRARGKLREYLEKEGVSV